MDTTVRFSNRVDAYVRARPGYPAELIDLLGRRCGLHSQAVVADIGSGTGILTRLLLERGWQVSAVEPNAPMRLIAERALGSFEGFTSIAATAEATTLASQSVDLVTAGQAFHWFDRQKARSEFGRILRPGGWVALIWNDRRMEGTPFLAAYERLLRTYCTDYAAVNHKRITVGNLQAFFGGSHVQSVSFVNTQRFDLPMLQQRLSSSSYTPVPGHPGYEQMLNTLADIFERYQVEGVVQMDYDTRVFYGQLR